MTETYRPSPAQPVWELVELIERREDFEKLLAVSQKAARLNPKLKKDFQAVIVKFRLYEILKVERGPGKSRLTLANLWRLSRHENRPGLFPEAFDPAEVTLEAFDLAEGVWKEEDPGEIHWINVRHPWRDNFYRRIRHLRLGPCIWPDLCIEETPSRENPISYFNLLAGLTVKIFRVLGIEYLEHYDDLSGLDVLVNSLLGRFTKLSRSAAIGRAYVLARSFSGRVRKLPYKQPSRALQAALGRHVLDDEVLSLARLMRKDIHLSDYLKARAQRKHLARLARETPDFMPVLDLIPCEWWARRDLLRDKVLRFTNPIFKYASAAGLRWLRRASAKALGHFCQRSGVPTNGRRPWGVLVIEVMAELSPWPGGAFWESCQAVLIEETLSLGLCLYVKGLMMGVEDVLAEVDPVSARRLVRTLARHLLNRAADQRRQRADLDEMCVPALDKDDVADWYIAEGQRRGLPDKNSTWVSLRRRAERWHQEIWRREMAEDENAAWESLLGPLEMEGIKIKPLVTGLELYNEGREMRHCIVSYAQRCLEFGYRIFSLIEPDGRRSTLSLRPSSSGVFVLDQHKGPENAPASRAAARAARKICGLYTREYQESGGVSEGR